MCGPILFLGWIFCKLYRILSYESKIEGMNADVTGISTWQKGKNVLRQFYPDEYKESTYSIDFEALRKEGYKAILFDIDNTLVPHGAPADERAKQLFDRLHSLGYRCMMLSNNKEPRVRSFCEEVKAGYIYKAAKPRRACYIKGMKMLKADTTNTLFIGDQIFTDIWGAKRAGIRTILVKPIDKKEEIQIILKRYLERIVLFFYLKEYKRAENRHGN